MQHVYDTMFPENELDMSSGGGVGLGCPQVLEVQEQERQEAALCQKQEVQSISVDAAMLKCDDTGDAEAGCGQAEAANDSSAPSARADALVGDHAAPAHHTAHTLPKAGDKRIPYNLVHFLCDLDGAGAANIAGIGSDSSAGGSMPSDR